jgi:hypothetical protein
MASVMARTVTASRSETWQPTMMRLRISRPRLSVPSQCWGEGGVQLSIRLVSEKL